MMEIKVRVFFDSAHRLPDSKRLTTKKCTNLHGHTYCADVQVRTAGILEGMVVDFGFVKDIVNELDHTFINDVFSRTEGWRDESTTAENIALYLREKLEIAIPGASITIHLSEGYKGENSSWVTT